ncbi:MAG TPA: hypothetical protein PK131_02220 [Candidatus Woesebacteria bacterium]|nr:hypothetical protein [Candidatus Woesebacteria bacterium]HRS22839.1 hypothetical protein [Candidatus Woesebacteria bacterium]HRT40377.1 hypothetical protein [Candidatus Woesebacteria bacterium]
MKPAKFDLLGASLIVAFFLALTYAGYLAYKSIDYKILDKLESAPLILPTPIPTSFSTETATPSSLPQ